MRFVKAIAALIGGLTPAAIIGFLSLFHVNVDEATVTKVLAALTPITATVAVAAAPKNADKGEQKEHTPIEFSVPQTVAQNGFEERETIDIPQNTLQ